MDNIQYLIEEFRQHRKETSDKLEKILVQTTKTNGRVDALVVFKESAESDIEEFKKYSSEIKGRDKVIGFVVGVVLTIFIAIISWLLSKH